MRVLCVLCLCFFISGCNKVKYTNKQHFEDVKGPMKMRILFSANQCKISSAEMFKIKLFSTWIAQHNLSCEKASFVIVGYSSSTDEKENEMLSRCRAMTVAQVLKDLNPDIRVTIKSQTFTESMHIRHSQDNMIQKLRCVNIYTYHQRKISEPFKADLLSESITSEDQDQKPQKSDISENKNNGENSNYYGDVLTSYEKFVKGEQ